MKTISFVKCGLGVLGVMGILNPAMGAVPEKPNILFIFADDMGKEWVSSYGAEGIETPNIDRLANTGLTFESFYSMPQCTPSRITLFTGQYPFRHGWINHWDVPRWGGGAQFDWEKNPGIALAMQSAGYKTAAAGKWQVNDFRVQPEAMVSHGFDDYCMWTGGEMPDHYTFDGVSLAFVILGRTAESPREWIMSMGGQNNAALSEKGVENQYRFHDRVIRDKEYKLYVSPERKPEKLVNLKKDPEEKHNLLHTDDPAARAVLNKFWKVVEQMPEKDNDPIYTPHPPQSWDVEVTVKSQEWKK